MRSVLPVFFTSLLLTIMSHHSHAQDPIISSRPGQSFVPQVVGKNVFQVQTGLSYSEETEKDRPFTLSTINLNTQLRYGLSPRLEVRTSFNATRQTVEDVSFGFADNDFFNSLLVGVKYNILPGGGKKPALSLQPEVALNFLADNSLQDLTPRILLIHSQQLSNTFSLTTNLGTTLLNDRREDNLVTFLTRYSVNLSFPLGQKTTGFVENYGQILDGDIDVFWDAGAAYLLNNDVLLDISGGYGSNSDIFTTRQWFAEAGISFRL